MNIITRTKVLFLVFILIVNLWVTQTYAQVIRDIQPRISHGELELFLISDNPIQNYKADCILSDGLPKIVFDLLGNWRYPQGTLRLESDIAESIRIGKHSDKLRIVADLKDRESLPEIKNILSYTIRETSDGLILNIKRTDPERNTATKTDEKTGRAAYSVLKAGDVLVPEKAGKIQSYFEGAAEQPLIFIIGESHVSLKVQQEVADLLTYLRGAYNLKFVFTEGYDKPFPNLHKEEFLIAERIVAHSQFMSRRINAIEYIALTYPDIQVVGVEDMSAYNTHGQILEKEQQDQQSRAKKWGNDFLRFIKEDVGSLKVSKDKAEKFGNALDKFKNKQDFDALTEVLYDITGRESETGKNLTSLLERRKALANPELMTNIPEMERRDNRMSVNTLRIAREEQAKVATLVVGKLHLSGIEKEFKERRVSYVSIVPAGVDEELKNGMSEDDSKVYKQWKDHEKTLFEKWLSQFKPTPRITDNSFIKEFGILQIGVYSETELRNRRPEQEVLEKINNALQSYGIRCENVYLINGGVGIRFSNINGETAYIYFSDEVSRITSISNFEKIDEGKLYDKYYAIYEGGGGNLQPPIPPIEGGGTTPNEPFGGYLPGIQRRHNQAVVICLAKENNKLILWINDKKREIQATPQEVRDLFGAFGRSTGQEKVYIANNIVKALSLDTLNLPNDSTVLYQISQDDIIGDLSLPFIARLSDNMSANIFARIKQEYTIPWSNIQQNFDSIISQSVPIVEVTKTVVLISDDLKNVPEYQNIVESMQRKGVRVNEITSETKTVILLGSYDSEWKSRISGNTVKLTSVELQTIIQNAENVVSFNAKLPDSVRVKRLYNNQLNIEDKDILDIGHNIVEEIRKNREPIDSLVRRIIDNQRIRELLTSRQGIQNSVEIEVARLGEKTTLFGRTAD